MQIKKDAEVSSLVIYGCGGHARSVADVALSNGIRHLIFVDEQARKDEKIFNFDVIKKYEKKDHDSCIVAIGDNRERSNVYDVYKKNIVVISLVSYGLS